MAFQNPNYTQVPNDLFDLMPELSETELKVTLAIIRKTRGWQKDFDQLSISQLEKITGLSNSSVIKGVKAGLARGTIDRKPHGQSYLYSVKSTDLQEQPMKNLHRSYEKSSQVTYEKSSHTKERVKESNKEKTLNGDDQFFESCLSIYQETKYPTWTNHSKFTDTAKTNLRKLKKHFGNTDAALAALKDALTQLRSDTWTHKNLSFENLSSNDKLISEAEKYRTTKPEETYEQVLERRAREREARRAELEAVIPDDIRDFLREFN